MGQGRNELSNSHQIKSLSSVSLLLFGLSIIQFHVSDRIFSQLTLQETDSIETFSELASRNDIIAFNISERHSNKTKLFKSFDYETDLPLFLTQPNHVMIADYYNAEIFYQSYVGLPIRIASEKLDFSLIAKYPIRFRKTANKQWIQKLKNCMKSFYETGFFFYGYNLKLAFLRQNAMRVLRHLYQTGRIDDNEVRKLSLFQLKQSFLILILCSVLAFVLFGCEMKISCNKSDR